LLSRRWRLSATQQGGTKKVVHATAEPVDSDFTPDVFAARAGRLPDFAVATIENAVIEVRDALRGHH
jgi:hypothetical protein